MKQKTQLNPCDVNWDKIIIIDCLSEEERQKHEISEDLMQFLADKGIKQQCCKCNDKKSFLEACECIICEAKKGRKFCLHIVSHGNNDGIGIKETNEPILWKELGSILEQMNNAMNGNLILNMTSCMGLYGIKIDDYVQNNPFFGLIGYRGELKIKIGKEINELFYFKISEGKPIQVVIPEIKKELNDNDLYCISTQGYNMIKNEINQTNVSH
jgi:hypothetical protein